MTEKELQQLIYENRYNHSMKNEELQKILKQFPKDALVVVEYCNIRHLKYNPDRNLIIID